MATSRIYHAYSWPSLSFDQILRLWIVWGYIKYLYKLKCVQSSRRFYHVSSLRSFQTYGRSRTFCFAHLYTFYETLCSFFYVTRDQETLPQFHLLILLFIFTKVFPDFWHFYNVLHIFLPLPKIHKIFYISPAKFL